MRTLPFNVVAANSLASLVASDEDSIEFVVVHACGFADVSVWGKCSPVPSNVPISGISPGIRAPVIFGSARHYFA